jgi:hypothetical protein
MTKMHRLAIKSLLLLGCGPVIDANADDESSSSVTPTTDPSSPETTSPLPDPDSGPIPDPDSGVDPDPTTATTATSTTTTDPTEDTWDDGCNFLCEPDGGFTDIECDVWAQDCPDGEKCMPWAYDGGSAWNGTRCSPVADFPAEIGEPCVAEGSGVSGIDNCELGSMCFGVDEETLEGLCVGLCYGTADQPMCDDGMICAAASDSVINLCLPQCNPLEQDCAEGEACYEYGGYFMCTFVEEALPFGEPCEFLNVCAAGLFCAPPEDVPGCEGMNGCCSSYCDLSVMNASDTCPGVAGGQECVPWYEDGQAPPGLENVGACVVPP